jgi:hypothetical protein
VTLPPRSAWAGLALRSDVPPKESSHQKTRPNATHEDVRYLRRSMDMLVRNDAAQEAAIKTLTARVTRLEKKVGLTH